MPELTLRDLANALVAYGPHYDAIDVFADDVRELVRLRETRTMPPELLALDGSATRFRVTLDSGTYDLTVDREAGVARMSRAGERSASTSGSSPEVAVIAGAVGAAIGAAASKKGDGWLPGLVVGLLAGAVLGTGGASGATMPPRRVFTLSFDPQVRQWRAYEGGLARWLKSTLLEATG